MSSKEARSIKQDHLMSMLQEVREELSQIPGVFTVGVGLKEVANRHTPEIVYRVYVREKKNAEDLQPHEMVPKQIRGVNTDVLVVPKGSSRGKGPGKRGDDNPYPTLQAGIMVGNGYNGAGTLGCIATLNKNGTIVILSNYHVLGEEIEAGDFVGQPTFREHFCRCCGCHSGQVGILIYGKRNSVVDVAIANTLPSVLVAPEKGILNKLDPQILKIKGIGVAAIGDHVFKVGALSGHTVGLVTEIAGPVDAGNPDRVNQMYIVPADDDEYHEDYREEEANKVAFSDKGDSGSLVLNKDGKIVGLLWGGSPAFKLKKDDPDPLVDTSFCTNIHDVLVHLEEAGFGITIANTPDPEPESIASPLQTIAAVREKDFRQKLREIQQGEKWLQFFDTHTKEINQLINSDRHVAATWQRNQGPAYTAHLLKSDKDTEYLIPLTIENITLQELLVKMASILKARGSDALKKDVEKYALDIIDYASGIESVNHLLERLKEQVLA